MKENWITMNGTHILVDGDNKEASIEKFLNKHGKSLKKIYEKAKEEALKTENKGMEKPDKKKSVSQGQIDQAREFARFFKKTVGSRGGFTVSEKDLDNTEKEMLDDIKKYSSGAKLGSEKYVDTKELAYAIAHPDYVISNMGDSSVDFLIKNGILPKSRFDKLYF